MDNVLEYTHEYIAPESRDLWKKYLEPSTIMLDPLSASEPVENLFGYTHEYVGPPFEPRDL